MYGVAVSIDDPLQLVVRCFRCMIMRVLTLLGLRRSILRQQPLLQCPRLLVQPHPLWQQLLGHLELGRLGERIVAQVDGLRVG